MKHAHHVRRCKISVCRHEESWSWQPFGPDEDYAKAFALPGSHYRGFAVIPCCDDHKHLIQGGAQDIAFTYKSVPYIVIATKHAIEDAPF